MNTKWVELVRIYRGESGNRETVEASHLGAIAVVAGDGKLLYSLGDVDSPTHLRSTAKPFQLLPFVLRNLQTKAKLSESEVALLMASHGGEKYHVDALNQILAKCHIKEEELLCGIHAPTHDASKHALIAAGQKPSVLHNNCSGKHCAMLAVAKEMGWSLADYVEIEHPLQREIRTLLARVSGVGEDEIGVGVDGCSAATFILPLQAIAKSYAMLALPVTSDGNLNAALKLLFLSGTRHPEMIAGSKRLDTTLIRRGSGCLFAKTGAEGVYTIAVAPSVKYPLGLGIAIKIADGDATHRARNAVVISVLLQLGVLGEKDLQEDTELSAFGERIVRNLRGLEVGKIRTVFQLTR